LNGDIFDFDSVMSVPDKIDFPIKPYEFKLGLNSMEVKSVYKMEKILQDHFLWTQRVSNFIKNGNKVVFVVGNHDLELVWVGVQNKIREMLSLTDEENNNLIFCEWFYISEEDTLIEHGHQYDPYCLALNPINPIIRKLDGVDRVRLPFGNLANRFIINDMGLKNPHNDESYTKSFWEFLVFFFKYELKVQPFMFFTWIFGSFKTMLYSLGEAMFPAVRDPLTIHEKIKNIAQKSNTSEGVVLSLRENHAHPAVRRPFKIIQELWLDRAFLLIGLLWFSWIIFSTSNVFSEFSIWWFWLYFILSIPVFIYYSHGISSDIHNNQDLALRYAPISAKICGVKRIVLGHTHKPEHRQLQGLEYLNPGTWSIYFEDVECTLMRYDRKFVWIKAGNRSAGLYNWKNGKIEKTNRTQNFESINKYKKLVKKG
jgi:UDP-2,3-diacylglucosamine pyrophosphatase LpxH